MSTLRRLLPEPADVELADALVELRPWEWAREERPYLLTNFALTLDGRATLGGVSGQIGSEVDTAMLVALRSRVDAVMIGAGTLRAEGYGRIVSDPARRELREAEGLSADPLMVVVSGRLDLPWDGPLLTDGHGQLVVITASKDEVPETPTPVHVIRHDGAVDLPGALAELRRDHGVRALLCEGGPHLHADLIAAALVDELFVTHAPKLSGGEGPGLVAGLPEAVRGLELVWLLHEPATGELFARYRA